ncbi:MAG TPA: helix-turn-helix transcriptional regulator [Desulfosporosinus sp.]|nr:helix-turn-helix transcriptional regulator [Desulfosporosinus sp.]
MLLKSRGDDVGKNLRLKSSRAAKDMSQKVLAEAAGVTRQTINAIENGDYNPSVNLCISICRILGKTLDQIFWEDDDDAEK